MPLQCYFECTDDGKLYSFPKHKERFIAWKTVLHPLAQEYSKEYISRHFRLCYRHFKDCYILPSQRLTINAVPTLNLVQYGGNDVDIPNVCKENINEFEEGGSVSKIMYQNEDQSIHKSNFEPFKSKVELSDDGDVDVFREDINKFKEEWSDLKAKHRIGEHRIINNHKESLISKDVEASVDENIEDMNKLIKAEPVIEIVSQNDEQRADTKDYENLITMPHVYEKKQESAETNHTLGLDRLCLNLKVILESTNANLIRSHSRIGYTCFFCDNHYKNPAELKEHCLDNHTSVNEVHIDRNTKCAASKLDVTRLHCRLCNNNIDTLKNLIDHLKEIHIKNIYIDRMNQVLPIKFINSLYQCGVCSEVFQKIRILLSHFSQTHYRNYVCNECDMGFVVKCDLRHHIPVIHGVDFTCEFCSKHFKTKFKRDKHERFVHSRFWTRNCNFCEKKFKNLFQIEQHTLKAHRTQMESTEMSIDVKPSGLDKLLLPGLYGIPSSGEGQPHSTVLNTFTADDIHRALESTSGVTETPDSSISIQQDSEELKRKHNNECFNKETVTDIIIHTEEVTENERQKIVEADSKSETSPDNITDVDKHFYNIKVILESTNATLIHSHDNHGFRCYFCDKHYKNLSDLKAHAIETHTAFDRTCFANIPVKEYEAILDITNLLCKLCVINIDNLEHLIDHLNVNHDKKIFLDIKNEILPFKFINELFMCSVCPKDFRDYKSLLEHLPLHYRSNVCIKCDLGFINMKKFMQHNRIHRVSRFQCPFCKQKFTSRLKIDVHVKKVHDDNLICGICDMRIKYWTRAATHLTRVHNVKPTIKDIVAKSAKTNTSVNTGNKSDSITDKSIDAENRCRTCDQTFATQDALYINTKQCIKSIDESMAVDEHSSNVTEYADNAEFKEEASEKSENLSEIMVKLEDTEEQDKHIYNIKTILECTNATLIRSYEYDGYACFFCDKCYQNPSKLKQHATNTHTIIFESDLKNIDEDYVAKLDVTELYCKICYRYINTLQNLGSHLNEAHNKKLFVDIKNQIVPLIFNKSSPTCCICFRTWVTYRGLMLHLLVHYKKYLWSKTDSSFIDMEKLHGNFSCNYCPKIFHDELKKKDHVNEVHKDKILRFKCEKCNEQFRLNMQKKLHLLKAHNISLKENKCDDVPVNSVGVPNVIVDSTDKFTQPIGVVDMPNATVDSTRKCLGPAKESVNLANKTNESINVCNDSIIKPQSFDELDITPDSLSISIKQCTEIDNSLSGKNENTSKVVTEVISKYEDDTEIIEIDDQTPDKPEDLPIIVNKYEMTDEDKYKGVHNIKTILEFTNANLILSREDFGYTCYFCCKYFKDSFKLKEHAMNMHTYIDEKKIINTYVAGFVYKLDVSDLYCKLCYRYIDTLEDLSKHLSEHGKKIFVDVKSHLVPLKFQNGVPTCCICLETCNDYNDLVEHVIIHYSGYIKTKCDVGFINTEKLHERDNVVDDFPCRLCPRKFESELNKADHEIKVHNYDFFLYKCEICDERFQFVNHKNLHLLAAHKIQNIKKWNKCDNANISSSSINSLTNLDKSVNNPDTEIATECKDIVELSDDEEQGTDKIDSNSQVKTNKSQDICDKINTCCDSIIALTKSNTSITKPATEDVSQHVDIVELSDEEERGTGNSDSDSQINMNKYDKTNIRLDNILTNAKESSDNPNTEIITQYKKIENESLENEEQRLDKRDYESQFKLILRNGLTDEEKHFNNIKVILECTNATLIRSREELGYTCLFCNKFFKTLSELKDHSISTHSNIKNIRFANIYIASYVAKLDITGLQCRLCSSYIDTVKNLFGHLRETHKKNVYTELRKQILPLKLNRDMFQCCVCFQNFKKFVHLLNHMQRHYKNYVCIKCDKGFDRRNGLIYHLKKCK